MADLLDVMATVSGIPRTESLAIWEAVKANHARLDACAGPHDFSIPQRVNGVAGEPGYNVREWACTKCGGSTDSIHKHWYEKGLAHGRG